MHCDDSALVADFDLDMSSDYRSLADGVEVEELDLRTQTVVQNYWELPKCDKQNG